MSLTHLYISDFSSQRPTIAQDSYGAGAETFTENIASFSGRLQKKNTTENQESGRITETSNFNLYCDPSNDITALDRVLLGDRIFEVVTVDDANQQGVFIKVELVERK